MFVNNSILFVKSREERRVSLKASDLSRNKPIYKKFTPIVRIRHWSVVAMFWSKIEYKNQSWIINIVYYLQPRKTIRKVTFNQRSCITVWWCIKTMTTDSIHSLLTDSLVGTIVHRPLPVASSKSRQGHETLRLQIRLLLSLKSFDLFSCVSIMRVRSCKLKRSNSLS